MRYSFENRTKLKFFIFFLNVSENHRNHSKSRHYTKIVILFGTLNYRNYAILFGCFFHILLLYRRQKILPPVFESTAATRVSNVNRLFTNTRRGTSDSFGQNIFATKYILCTFVSDGVASACIISRYMAV